MLAAMVGSAGESAERLLERLADRLRHLSEPRLRRPEPALGGSSPAHAAHDFAMWCAATTVELLPPDAAARPPTAEVPRLGDLASGDQVWVLGRHLLVASGESNTDQEGLIDELVRRIQKLTDAL